ncbi:MAG: helix-turn-helix transcriptional regulator [Allosphingosinicella sp.]
MNMLAHCFERMRQGACDSCENRDNCAFHWSSPEGLFARRTAGGGPGAAAFDGSPVFAFLAGIGKAFERRPRPKPTPFRSEIERRIEPMLEEGDVGIDRIARELGLSRQTLYRRLKEEGTTFAALVDGVRRRVALRLVRERALSVKQIAYRLGFSDPAAFSRAFKRWTGSSPSTMHH